MLYLMVPQPGREARADLPCFARFLAAYGPHSQPCARVCEVLSLAQRIGTAFAKLCTLLIGARALWWPFTSCLVPLSACCLLRCLKNFATKALRLELVLLSVLLSCGVLREVLGLD